MTTPWPHEPLVSWARGRLAGFGWAVTGQPAVVRAMPWASVVRLPTDRGDVWAKGAAAPFRYEMLLLPLLARHGPDVVPPPLALDPDRGFALLRDGGPALDAVLADGLGSQSAPARRREAVEIWTAALVRYAALQRAMTDRVEELLAAGLPDLRPAVAADRFAELTDRADLLVVGGPHGVTSDEADAVRALAPLAARAAARLDGDAVPASVQHDDLQPSRGPLCQTVRHGAPPCQAEVRPRHDHR